MFKWRTVYETLVNGCSHCIMDAVKNEQSFRQASGGDPSKTADPLHSSLASEPSHTFDLCS